MELLGIFFAHSSLFFSNSPLLHMLCSNSKLAYGSAVLSAAMMVPYLFFCCFLLYAFAIAVTIILKLKIDKVVCYITIAITN